MIMPIQNENVWMDGFKMVLIVPLECTGSQCFSVDFLHTCKFSHSFQEFVDQTKRADFEQDNGWQGLDEQELYSQHEYEEYERQRQEEIQKLIESGAVSFPLSIFAFAHLVFSLLPPFQHCFAWSFILFLFIFFQNKENEARQLYSGVSYLCFSSLDGFHNRMDKQPGVLSLSLVLYWVEHHSQYLSTLNQHWINK